MDRKFELFEINSNIEKLRQARENYINSLNDNICFKAVSNRSDWFKNKDEIFDVKAILGKKFFDFNLIPVSSNDYARTITNFIQFGATDLSNIKSLVFNNESYYFYTNIKCMDKQGKRYVALPVIPLSQDIYNLSLISLLDFNRLDLDDISEYSSYFTVSDEANFVIYENRLEDAYRNGTFTITEYKKMVSRFEKEERLVHTLKKNKNTSF